MRTALLEADALQLAKELSPEAIEATGRRVEIADLEELIAGGETKPQDELIDLGEHAALELGVPAGKIMRRDALVARRRLVQRLRAPRSAFTDGRQNLIRRRIELRAQLQPIEAELAEIEAALTDKA